MHRRLLVFLPVVAVLVWLLSPLSSAAPNFTTLRAIVGGVGVMVLGLLVASVVTDFRGRRRTHASQAAATQHSLPPGDGDPMSVTSWPALFAFRFLVAGARTGVRAVDSARARYRAGARALRVVRVYDPAGEVRLVDFEAEARAAQRALQEVVRATQRKDREVRATLERWESAIEAALSHGRKSRRPPTQPASPCGRCGRSRGADVPSLRVRAD